MEKWHLLSSRKVINILGPFIVPLFHLLLTYTYGDPNVSYFQIGERSCFLQI